MATYLVVRNGDKQTSYRCSSTHTNKPYIQVKENCYLDLTTNTSSGLQLNVKLSKRTNTFVTTTGYKGYFSCRQSTAEGIKMSSDGSTYTTTDYEPFISFTSTANYTTRNVTYTRTSYNAGILSSTTALTRTSSEFNNGIYKPVTTSLGITSISSQSEVDYTISTSTSRSSSRNSTSGYSGRSTYSTSRSSLSGYSGQTSSARTTASGWRSTSTSSPRTSTSGYSGKRTSQYVSTYGYSGKRRSNYTYSTYYSGKRASVYTNGTYYSGQRASVYTNATSYSGYTKTSTKSKQTFTLYGGGKWSTQGGGKSGQGNVTWNYSQNRTSSGQATAQPVKNYSPVRWLIRNPAKGQWYTSKNAIYYSTYAQISHQKITTYKYSTTSVNAVIYYTATRLSNYTSANANGMMNATAKYYTATRTSAVTSSVAGALSSVTALYRTSTRLSNYTSVNANGMSSATALTRTASRTSQYTSANANGMLSATALTKSYSVSVSTRYGTSNYIPYVADFTSSQSSTVQISGYKSSVSSAGMYNTTGLTRSSSYNTSSYKSSTEIGVLLSTTALIRSSYFTVSTSTSRSSSSNSSYTFLTSTSLPYV